MIRTERERAEKAEEDVEKVKEEYSARLDKEAKRAEEAEAKAEHYRLREANREEEIKARANKMASRVVKATMIVIAILLVVGSLSSANWGVKFWTSWVRDILLALQVVVLLLGARELIWGTSLKTLSRKVEVKMAEWFERILKKISISQEEI